MSQDYLRDLTEADKKIIAECTDPSKWQDMIQNLKDQRIAEGVLQQTADGAYEPTGRGPTQSPTPGVVTRVITKPNGERVLLTGPTEDFLDHVAAYYKR